MTRTNSLLIRTPEGVVFSQTLAGPVARFLAWRSGSLPIVAPWKAGHSIISTIRPQCR